MSNRLLRRISGLKKEKGELMLQVEQEEEYLTRTLQNKLSQVRSPFLVPIHAAQRTSLTTSRLNVDMHDGNNSFKRKR